MIFIFFDIIEYGPRGNVINTILVVSKAYNELDACCVELIQDCAIVYRFIHSNGIDTRLQH